MAQILSEQAGYTDTDTRVIQESATVSVQGSTESIRSTWSLIVFTGYPDITGASEEVCLAVIDHETVREFACAGVEYMDSGALTLEFVDGDLTNLVTLGSEGDISIFAPIAAG